MKSKLFAVVILAAIGVGAVVFAAGGLSVGTANAVEYQTSPATVGDVTEEVAATGAIAPASRTGVAFGRDPFVVYGFLFLLPASVIVLRTVVEQSELRTRERLLELEYKLAQLAERSPPAPH